MADKADRKRPSVGVIAQVTSPGLRLTAAPIGDALAEKKPRPSPSAADRDEYEGSLDGPDFIFARYASEVDIHEEDTSRAIVKGPGYAILGLRANDKLVARPNAKYTHNRPVFSALGGPVPQVPPMCDLELSRELECLQEHLPLVDDAAGTALKVALIDTGVDAKSFYQHFSEDRCRCKLYCFDVTKPTPGEWIVERVGDAASDASGHATHLASIIAQVALKYRRAVAIYSYKVISAGPNNQVAKAGWAQVAWSMLNAYQHGCRTFNFSIGSQVDDDLFQPDGAFCTVLNDLRGRGERIGLCCAVGNSGNQLDAAWPARLAAHNYPEIISIGAHDSNRRPYAENQKGARVLSYGVNVSGLNGNTWESRSGTSQAAAVLSAVHLLFSHANHLGTLPPVAVGQTKTVVEVYEEHKRRNNAHTATRQLSRSVGSAVLTVNRSTDSSTTGPLASSTSAAADLGMDDARK